MLSDNITINSEKDEILKAINTNALRQTHKDLNLSKPVQYFFLTDEELLSINKSSLNHDYYTDIITFDYSDDDDIPDNEILISWERLKDNSKSFGCSLEHELHRVCIHGLLHLAGYDDKTPEEKQKMTSQEDHYLALHCST